MGFRNNSGQSYCMADRHTSLHPKDVCRNGQNILQRLDLGFSKITEFVDDSVRVFVVQRVGRAQDRHQAPAHARTVNQPWGVKGACCKFHAEPLSRSYKSKVVKLAIK